MHSSKISSNHLLNWGFPEGPAFGLALKTLHTFEQTQKLGDTKATIIALLETPTDFLNDPIWKEVANELILAESQNTTLALSTSDKEFAVYGQNNIEEGALKQMSIAMKLPVTHSGALMADAHQGYGLPIGGVLATKNAVIPYGVGVDIGCRMCLSIFDIDDKHFQTHHSKLQRELIAWTKFGAGSSWQYPNMAQHDVLDRSEFDSTPLLRSLKDKAQQQLGTSGGGNHFVEWGIIEFAEADTELGIPKGNYLALLSHSGSRGVGATIAGHYTRIAKEVCKLPSEAQNLAYFDLNSQEGQEYWIAMNLAGDYASACHHVIHDRLSAAIGGEVIARVENHHNFAWKEKHGEEELIVHRKGATPAGENVLGFIPGSMTAPGFLVRGKGESASLASASHGAGRMMSRTLATKSISKNDMRSILRDHGVTLIGAGTDEAPMAYKNIHEVMKAQVSLVDTIATFHPKIVRMADDGSRED